MLPRRLKYRLLLSSEKHFLFRERRGSRETLPFSRIARNIFALSVSALPLRSSIRRLPDTRDPPVWRQAIITARPRPYRRGFCIRASSRRPRAQARLVSQNSQAGPGLAKYTAAQARRIDHACTAPARQIAQRESNICSARCL